jgi:hypothetical protein
MRLDRILEWHDEDSLPRSISDLDDRISPHVIHFLHELPSHFHSFRKGGIKIGQLCAVRIHLKLVPVSNVEIVQGHHDKKPALGEHYRRQTTDASPGWRGSRVKLDRSERPQKAGALQAAILLRRRFGSENLSTGTQMAGQAGG